MNGALPTVDPTGTHYSESTINVALYGENFDVTASIEYAGKAFAQLESSVRETELLEDL